MADEIPGASSYLDDLPAFCRSNVFLGRFLLAFEQVLSGFEGATTEPAQGLEQTIAHLWQIFDPTKTKGAFLEWLAGWAALSLRADWTEAQQREFLGRIIPLYQRRGTRDNLRSLLQIYTGLPPVITEGVEGGFQIGVHSTLGVDATLRSSRPHYFHILVNMPRASTQEAIDHQSDIIRWLVDHEKPAHTYYDFEIVAYTMQIGVRSTVGVDTLFGDIPADS